MWNEAALAYFQVLFQYFPGVNEENHEKALPREPLSRLGFEPATCPPLVRFVID
jgi:hypothetical protein